MITRGPGAGRGRVPWMNHHWHARAGSVRPVPWAGGQQPVAMKIRSPELQGIDEWINSKPLSLKDLKGKVIVVHFWAFG